MRKNTNKKPKYKIIKKHLKIKRKKNFWSLVKSPKLYFIAKKYKKPYIRRQFIRQKFKKYKRKVKRQLGPRRPQKYKKKVKILNEPQLHLELQRKQISEVKKFFSTTYFYKLQKNALGSSIWVKKKKK